MILKTGVLASQNHVENGNQNIESFVLVPTESFHGQVKELDVPANIILKQHYSTDRQKQKIENFLQKLNRVNIRRTKDGLLSIANKVTDINFDDFVADWCKEKFFHCYEDVYCNRYQSNRNSWPIEVFQ